MLKECIECHSFRVDMSANTEMTKWKGLERADPLINQNINVSFFSFFHFFFLFRSLTSVLGFLRLFHLLMGLVFTSVERFSGSSLQASFAETGTTIRLWRSCSAEPFRPMKEVYSHPPTAGEYRGLGSSNFEKSDSPSLFLLNRDIILEPLERLFIRYGRGLYGLARPTTARFLYMAMKEVRSVVYQRCQRKMTSYAHSRISCCFWLVLFVFPYGEWLCTVVRRYHDLVWPTGNGNLEKAGRWVRWNLND